MLKMVSKCIDFSEFSSLRQENELPSPRFSSDNPHSTCCINVTNRAIQYIQNRTTVQQSKLQSFTRIQCSMEQMIMASGKSILVANIIRSDQPY